MNKKELIEILNNPISKLNLYNAVNLNFDDESQYDEQDYARFIFRNYWYRMKLYDPEFFEVINEKLGIDGTF